MPIREPSCLGCYPADADDLREFTRDLFTQPNASGLPRDVKPDGSLVAALLPHIDYARGGLTYTFGFKEVVERSDASLFVIVGTSHYSHHRFTLTRDDFVTPLGVVPTDQRFIDRLVDLCGPSLFGDPQAHVEEHSIELEVVLLHALLERRRPFRIVPLVVGSFGDSVDWNCRPTELIDINYTIRCLREVHDESREPICWIISGDLAHIGPKFGDPHPVSDRQLEDSRIQELAILDAVERIDPTGYHRILAKEKDRRRICGFPPTFTVLDAIAPRSGRLLHYGRHVAPDRNESVSFASMAFLR